MINWSTYHFVKFSGSVPLLSTRSLESLEHLSSSTRRSSRRASNAALCQVSAPSRHWDTWNPWHGDSSNEGLVFCQQNLGFNYNWISAATVWWFKTRIHLWEIQAAELGLQIANKHYKWYTWNRLDFDQRQWGQHWFREHLSDHCRPWWKSQLQYITLHYNNLSTRGFTFVVFQNLCARNPRSTGHIKKSQRKLTVVFRRSVRVSLYSWAKFYKTFPGDFRCPVWKVDCCEWWRSRILASKTVKLGSWFSRSLNAWTLEFDPNRHAFFIFLKHVG